MLIIILIACAFAHVFADTESRENCPFKCKWDDFELTFDNGGKHQYIMNLCKAFDDGAVIKQQTHGTDEVSCGEKKYLRLQKREEYAMTLVTFADPDLAPNNCPCIRRSTIKIECSQKTKVISVREMELCHYMFRVQSPIACPE